MTAPAGYTGAGGAVTRTDPRVYQPQDDTQLLIDALDDVPVAGTRVLDLCTGSGAVAAAAAARGAAAVVAVDSCVHAVAATRLLGAGHPAWLTVRSSVAHYTDRDGFDVVTCNPPYVPAPEPWVGSGIVPGPAHAWNAGRDGRAVLDVLCARAAGLVRPGGVLLIVQSALAAPALTRRQLESAGFSVAEVRRRAIDFGPVMRSRRDWLVGEGLLRPRATTETLSVLAARAPAVFAPAAVAAASLAAASLASAAATSSAAASAGARRTRRSR